jgi:hypothetical protein
VDEDDSDATSNGESAVGEDYVDELAFYSEDKDEWIEPGREGDDGEEEFIGYDVNLDDRDDWS